MDREKSATVQMSASNEKASADRNESHATMISTSTAADETQAVKKPPPNGGWRAWTQVFGGFLLTTTTFGLVGTYGAFQDYYAADLLSSSSSTALGWIGGVQAFFLIAGGVVTGTLFDLGYVRPLVIIGSFLVVLGYMMTSLATQYYQVFLAQALCAGLGSACLYPVALATAAINFVGPKRNVAVSAASAGTAFGGIIWPLIFTRLLPEIGFGWTVRTIAFLVLFASIVAYASIVAGDIPTPGAARKVFELRALREPPFLVYTLAVSVMYTGYWSPFFYISVYASRALDSSPSMAFYILTITNASNLLFRFLPFFTGGRISASAMIMVSSIGITIVAFCWPAVTSIAGLIVWAVALGGVSATLSGVAWAVLPDLSPSLSVVGTRMGMVMLISSWGVMVGPPVSGAILGNLDDKSGYLGMQMWCGALFAAATILMIYPLWYVKRKQQKEG